MIEFLLSIILSSDTVVSVLKVQGNYVLKIIKEIQKKSKLYSFIKIQICIQMLVKSEFQIRLQKRCSKIKYQTVEGLRH